jgi:soluble lytic murein transglycosylase-like protein
MRVPSRSGHPVRFTQVTLATLAGLSLAASACVGSSSAGPDQPEPRSAAASRTALAPALLPSDEALADCLASRYRRATQEVVRYVATARAAGERLGLDPLLILAVMAVESSLDPEAESHYGAMGLMQIVPRFHGDSLDRHGGPATVLDPRVNILVGALVLKTYIDRSAGDLAEGLQRYAGARGDVEQRYARRVFAERQLLDQTAARRCVARARGRIRPACFSPGTPRASNMPRTTI